LPAKAGVKRDGSLSNFFRLDNPSQ